MRYGQVKATIIFENTRTFVQIDARRLASNNPKATVLYPEFLEIRVPVDKTSEAAELRSLMHDAGYINVEASQT